MGHSNVRPKVRRRKVAALAAYSRQFTVHNTKKGISPKVDHPLHYGDLENAITCPFTGHKFVPTNPHEIPSSKFAGLTVTGYDWVEPEGKLWVIPEGGFKQPKRLMKLKKRKYGKKHETTNGVGGIMIVQNTKPGRQKRNDFKQFKNYPYHLPKMNRVEYMEKLVEHKLAKWERKNPKPMDMFTEDVKKWQQLYENMKMHFRDVVISMYDKLPLIGRFKMGKTNATYMEKKIAEIKDINSEGHDINNLSKSSKLLKAAQEITDKVHARHDNLVSTNLRDHKRTKGRIILPTNLMMMRKAA